MAGLIVGACTAAAAEPACPQPLRIAFGDIASPPALLGHGDKFDEPPGWEVAAVRQALQRLGCAGDLVRLPARRMNAQLVAGEVDFALLYGPTPERLGTLAFPLDARGRPDVAWAPVFGRLMLFARAGTPPRQAWNGQLPRGWRVGVMPGSVQASLARERGWVIEPISAFESALDMLNAGRFDLLLMSREALTAEQRAGVVEWATVGRQPFFAPASAAFAKRHPAWTRRFWHELCGAVRRLQPDARPVGCGVEPKAVLR